MTCFQVCAFSETCFLWTNKMLFGEKKLKVVTFGFSLNLLWSLGRELFMEKQCWNLSLQGWLNILNIVPLEVSDLWASHLNLIFHNSNEVHPGSVPCFACNAPHSSQPKSEPAPCQNTLRDISPVNWIVLRLHVQLPFYRNVVRSKVGDCDDNPKSLRGKKHIFQAR